MIIIIIQLWNSLIKFDFKMRPQRTQTAASNAFMAYDPFYGPNQMPTHFNTVFHTTGCFLTLMLRHLYHCLLSVSIFYFYREFDAWLFNRPWAHLFLGPISRLLFKHRPFVAHSLCSYYMVQTNYPRVKNQEKTAEPTGLYSYMKMKLQVLVG